MHLSPPLAVPLLLLLLVPAAISGQEPGAADRPQATPPRAAPLGGPFSRERVTFRSGDLTLVGFLFKPAGAGPFPALLWNHGSEPNPGAGPQFDSVAANFVPAGYVVFAPTRRGHGQSQGTYIRDSLATVRAAAGESAMRQVMAKLLVTEQLQDQRAGLDYLRRLPFVDTSRLVVAGCSFGGIQTLLAAERPSAFRAAVTISPAAMNWDVNPAVRQRLLQGAASVDIPILLIQPPRDVSLGPARDLGAEYQRLHKPYRGKVFPDTLPGPRGEHCFGGAGGIRIWAPDALAFLDSVLARPRGRR